MAASAWTSAPARALDVLSDERLARLASRGDQRASNALFARHQAGLERYCRTILRHGADAEDAAQNALVAAHRALEGGTIPMRVKPWLYKIAHNEAISLVRSRRPAEELDETQLPVVAGVEEAGEIRQRLGQLMSDLRALTDRQREALVLRELCGLDYPEIAQTLGATEAAAQQTVFEARSALQQFGEGRALACEGVQRAMSDCDGMRLRTRRVRAHLRGCDGCRAFEAALRMRRRDLGLLFPSSVAGAGGAAALLGRIFGEPLAAALGLKGAVAGLAVLAGGGAVVATSVGGGDRAAPARPAIAVAAPALTPATPDPGRPGAASTGASQGRPTAAGRRAARRASDRTKPRRPRRAAGRRPAAPASAAPGAGTYASAALGAGSGGDRTPTAVSRQTPGRDENTGAAEPDTPLSRAPAPVQEVVTSTGGVAQETTAAVGDAVKQGAGAVQDAVAPAAGAVQGAIDDVTGDTTDAAAGLLASP